jgi:hypothetical protein
MEIIQEIGSYAGFAAVLGLAVLSALYFSQARDVKRLREWAGRAPERTAVPVEPQRVVAEPIARPAQQSTGVRKLPPVPKPPGAQPGVPTPAAAAAAGAAPAVARGPAPATPAAAGANATGTGEEAPADVTAMDTVIHPPPDAERDDAADGEPDEAAPPGPPAEDATVANGDEPADVDDLAEQGAGEEADPEDEDVVGEDGDDDLDAEADEEHGDVGPETGEWSPEDEHSDFDFTDEHDVLPATPAAARPPQPPRPFPRRTPPPRYGRGESTTILPSYDEIRSSEDDEAGSAHGSRRPALIAAGAVLVAAVLAFGVLQLTGSDDDSGSSSSDTVGLSARQTDEGADGGSDAKAAPIDPSSVTVAVLNGTQVPGLAAQIGDQIAGEGFQLGTVTNNFDQERAESVVLFAPGAEREAADVGRRLDISQREAIDPDSQSLAGDASVVIVAGADQTQ